MGQNDDGKLVVEYRLARSVVKIAGTVTSQQVGDSVAATRTGEVTLAVEADPNVDPLRIELDTAFAKEHEFELKLAADGRLAGVGSTATGQGAAVVLAGVRVAAMVARAAWKLAPFGLAAKAEDGEEKADPGLPPEEAALVERAASYAALVDSLEAALTRLAEQIAGGDDVANALERIKAVQAALAAARDQASTVSAQLVALREELYPEHVQTLTYALPTDLLPAIGDQAPETLASKDIELKGQLVAEIARTLGTVVAIVGDNADDGHSPPDEDPSAVAYRQPRRVRLAVYEGIGEAASGGLDELPAKFRRKTLMDAWVIDSQSSYGELPIRTTRWGQHKLTAEFGDAGTLVHLTNKDVSAAGELAKVATGAAGEVSTAVTDVDAIAKAFAKPQAPDAEMTALKAKVEKAKLDAELAKALKEAADARNGNAKAIKA